jgi:hypothetical protein
MRHSLKCLAQKEKTQKKIQDNNNEKIYREFNNNHLTKHIIGTCFKNSLRWNIT